MRGNGRRAAPNGLHPFLARVHARRAGLSPAHRRIADVFLTRPEDAVYATTTGIARELGNDIENLRATQAQLDHGVIEQVAETLWEARGIYVVGVRSAHSLAVFVHFALRLLGRQSHLLTPGIGDVPEQIVDAGRGDVVLGISFERYARTTVELFEACVARGATGVGVAGADGSDVGADGHVPVIPNGATIPVRGHVRSKACRRLT